MNGSGRAGEAGGPTSHRDNRQRRVQDGRTGQRPSTVTSGIARCSAAVAALLTHFRPATQICRASRPSAQRKSSPSSSLGASMTVVHSSGDAHVAQRRTSSARWRDDSPTRRCRSIQLSVSQSNDEPGLARAGAVAEVLVVFGGSDFDFALLILSLPRSRRSTSPALRCARGGPGKRLCGEWRGKSEPKRGGVSPARLQK